MNVLISGAGIAGTTLAWWLRHYGITTTLVDTAPALRTGGYLIDFWGAGFEIADRMGLLPEIRAAGYLVREVRVVDDAGRRIAGFPVDVFARATKGRYVSIRRGDLVKILFSQLSGVETLFGDAIAALRQDPDGVLVTFEGRAERRFDLVIGADGLHSRVRRVTWGPEEQFEHYLKLKVAAFEIDGYQPRDELTYVMYTQIGRQMSRFALRDDRTMFLMIFADSDAAISADPERQKAGLRDRFARRCAWECPRIIEAMMGVSDLYFDRVSQIRFPSDRPWLNGRVALVGDAASCVSLLGGQGAALAMTAAYLIAGELHQAPDHRTAFARYEQRFRPVVAEKQRLATRFAGTFAPTSHWSMFVQNRVMNLLTVPWIARLVFGRSFVDALSLPDY